MKKLISKVLVAGAIVAAFSLNVQAGTRPMLADTGKMSKMSKMDKMKMKDKKKMDKMGKMDKKMMKDTAKMKKKM